MTVEQFADLSHHNTTVDLAAYKRAGHTRIALKATDGRAFNDPAFVSRWKDAGRLKLSRVAYHYAQTETGGAQEADHILAILADVGGLGKGDVLALDVEDNDSATALRRADEFAAEFCRRMVARGHPTGLLYTGRWYADPAGITPADVPAGWRRLWLSDYSDATDTAMALPTGWTRAQVAARQFTNAAEVPGITGPCDYSRVLADWLAPHDQEDEDDMAVHRLYQDPGSPLVVAGGPGYWRGMRSQEERDALSGLAGFGDPVRPNARQWDLLRTTLVRLTPVPVDVDAVAAKVVSLLAQGGGGAAAGMSAAQITAAVVAGMHQVLAAGADATEQTP